MSTEYVHMKTDKERLLVEFFESLLNVLLNTFILCLSLL